MRSFTTSCAILLALVACGPGVTSGAQAGDTGTSVRAPGVAQPVPLAPVPASAPTLAPVAPPAPVPTVAPGPAFSRAPARPMREELGRPSVPQTRIAAPNAAAVAVNPSADQWRYRWHNGNWWYWTPEDRWVYRTGNEWTNYEPAVTFAPQPGDAAQLPQGDYSPRPWGYYSRPYGYATGYGSYYNYGPGYRGGYYGPDGYYGRPGISIGTRRGGGIRIGF
jgi:hypothetical protein